MKSNRIELANLILMKQLDRVRMTVKAFRVRSFFGFN